MKLPYSAIINWVNNAKKGKIPMNNQKRGRNWSRVRSIQQSQYSKSSMTYFCNIFFGIPPEAESIVT